MNAVIVSSLVVLLHLSAYHCAEGSRPKRNAPVCDPPCPSNSKCKEIEIPVRCIPPPCACDTCNPVCDFTCPSGTTSTTICRPVSTSAPACDEPCSPGSKCQIQRVKCRSDEECAAQSQPCLSSCPPARKRVCQPRDERCFKLDATIRFKCVTPIVNECAILGGIENATSTLCEAGKVCCPHPCGNVCYTPPPTTY